MTTPNAKGYIVAAQEYSLELAAQLDGLGLQNAETFARDLRGHLCGVAGRGGQQSPLNSWYVYPETISAISDTLQLILAAAPNVAIVQRLCGKISEAIACASAIEGETRPAG